MKTKALTVVLILTILVVSLSFSSCGDEINRLDAITSDELCEMIVNGEDVNGAVVKLKILDVVTDRGQVFFLADSETEFEMTEYRMHKEYMSQKLINEAKVLSAGDTIYVKVAAVFEDYYENGSNKCVIFLSAWC